MASISNKADFVAKTQMEVSLIHTLSGHEAAIYKLIPGLRPGTFYSCGGEGYVVEWEPELSAEGQLVARDSDSLYCLKLMSNGRLLMGTKNGMLISCQLGNPQAIRKLDIHKKGIYSIVSDDDFVFTAGGDGWLRILSSQTLNLIFSIQLSGKALRSVILMPHSGQILVAGTESKFFLLDGDTFDLKMSNNSTHNNSIFCLLPGPTAQFYSGGRDASLNLNKVGESIENMISIPAHMNTINDLALNKEQSLLASVSRDRTIKIWNATSLELLKVIDAFKFRSHTHSINAVLWLDNETLITGGDDRMIKVWKIDI